MILGVMIHLCGEYLLGFVGRYLVKSREGGKRLIRRIGSVHHSRLQLLTNTSRLTKFWLMVVAAVCHWGASRL